MNEQSIKTYREGSSLVVELDRKQVRNAFSGVMMEEIIAAMEQAGGDDSVRGVVFYGGPDMFSAGADLNEALALASVPQSVAYFGRWHRLCGALESSPKPVIAAVEGPCLTGGLELALACDLRIAGDGARFGITSSRIGTVPGGGGAQRLARVVGVSRAMELLFSADIIDAERAERIGLVNRLVPQGQALAQSLAQVEVYRERAPLSLAWNKRAVRRGSEMDLAAALEYETFLVSGIFSTADRSEGMSAFLQKRPAQFKGE